MITLIRKVKHFIYRVLRKFMKLIRPTNQGLIKTIYLYPLIKSKDKLVDRINRIMWALPDRKRTCVYIPVGENLIDYNIEQLKAPEHQADYLADKSMLYLIKPDYKGLRNDADLILIHDQKSIFSSSIISNIHKTIITDEDYYSIEESWNNMSLYYKTLTNKDIDEYKELSRNNFKQMRKENGGKVSSYCFVTGPSIDRYRDFDFENDSFKVVCNSIVKNKALLEYIKGVDLLTFADPVFHFGVSQYAEAFRAEALKVIEEYDCYVMIPIYAMPLMLGHYPQLKNRLIGMKSNHGRAFNFPDTGRLWVKGTPNILTLYMLPVSSTLTDEIYIIGADGRKDDETYYWKHSEKAQFTGLMESAFKTHTSFFRDVDYKKYYQNHCQTMEKLIAFGESKGKRYYTLTKSHIKALSKRLYNEKDEQI